MTTTQRSIEAVFREGALLTAAEFTDGLRLYKDLAFKYYLLEQSAELLKHLNAHEKDHVVAMLKSTILDANKHGEKAENLEQKGIISNATSGHSGMPARMCP